jgi:hypothetical protein
VAHESKKNARHLGDNGAKGRRHSSGRRGAEPARARVTLKPWPVEEYAPPKLSPLGQKLLGISSEEYEAIHGRKRKREAT